MGAELFAMGRDNRFENLVLPITGWDFAVFTLPPLDMHIIIMQFKQGAYLIDRDPRSDFASLLPLVRVPARLHFEDIQVQPVHVHGAVPSATQLHPLHLIQFNFMCVVRVCLVEHTHLDMYGQPPYYRIRANVQVKRFSYS